MAMQFWEAKRKRRLKTTLYLVVYLALACVVGFLFEMGMRLFSAEGYVPPIPYLGIWLVIFVCFVSFCTYLGYIGKGGALVAESLGGRKLTPATVASSKEAELLHIAEEMSLASRMPLPAIYVIEANEINAFAAGVKPKKAAIAVTTGALERLTRDELQGVVAHEFGHIASEDMRLGMRLAALLMGFFILLYIGLRLLEGSFFFGRGRNGGRGNGVALIALLLVVSGIVMWLAGTILRACVNRQREYLADASAVEFTRNPSGLASALRKTQAVNEKVQDMPKSGLSYSHLYLDSRSFMSRLFATHPPLSKRIAILEGKEK